MSTFRSNKLTEIALLSSLLTLLVSILLLHFVTVYQNSVCLAFGFEPFLLTSLIITLANRLGT